MSLASSGRTWEEASSPTAVSLARRFEAAWRAANGRRPDPEDFLPPGPHPHPAARLALLRADMTLRWQDGDRVGVESYLARYPDLGVEALIALIYEEFCLREDADETPDPAEFEARFPAVAPGLRRVLDIHGLVGSGQSSPSVPHPQTPAIPFPEAGQTIAGFRLVEELGRGAFARVFRAEERQLADRPVALKVARSGSREPQTLARLQHTHIVPVHSYRTDPATGLHLLCMPYFGRVTLAQILADPQVRVARSGADLVEALERLGPSEGPRLARSAGRSALAGRTFARAMAWWGARMAEALGHAHDRGVLHRDVKPSNVLVTDDAMPMLLDFNLAREVAVDDPEAPPQGLGGTLDYMAPEHLEALAEGTVDGVDSRSDIYGLGVVLYEALMGVRPFTTPREALSVGEALLTAAETRRAGAPRLRTIRPEVPTALESVVRRCLAPEPSDRYASAADLVIDLQAVADDRSLRFAREPLVNRTSRWFRRNRRPLAMALPVVLAALVVAATFVKRRVDDSHRRSVITHLIDEGKRSAHENRFAEAMVQFEAAARLAHQRMEPRELPKNLLVLYQQARERLVDSEPAGDIRELYHKARESYLETVEAGTIHANADALFAASEPLRFRLSGLEGDPETATCDLQTVLKPFTVAAPHDWTKQRTELTLLDEPKRARLLVEVDELLFLSAVALDRSGDPRSARLTVTTCDRAIRSSTSPGAWLALRVRRNRSGDAPVGGEDPSAETSASACFQWGLLHDHEGHRAEAIAWLERAVWLEPSDAWYQLTLALQLDRAGRSAEAQAHADIAVALRPHSPWVRYHRALIARRRGAFALAALDLRRTLGDVQKLPDSDRTRDLEREVRREYAALPGAEALPTGGEAGSDRRAAPRADQAHPAT